MNYEFKIIFDLYDEKIVEGKDPEWILVKKNLTKKWQVYAVAGVQSLQNILYQYNHAVIFLRR